MILHAPKSYEYVASICGKRTGRVTYGAGKTTCPDCLVAILAGAKTAFNK